MQRVSSLMAAHAVAWTSLAAVQADKPASSILASERCDRRRVFSQEATMTPFGSAAQMPDPEARPAIARIAAFAAAARPEQLAPIVQQLLKRNILDNLGCAIAALPGPPFQALREQFEEYRTPGRCTLIGGGKTSPDQAALFNSALVRYVDLLDSYMSPGGLCHPGDNFGTVLAAAEHVGASGEDFMLALAVAYEIQCRFTAVVPVMAKGFNHATQLAISASASAAKLLGLSAGETVRALRRPNRQRDRDRDGRQRLACLRACRTGVAMEGLLARDDGYARRLRRLVGQAQLHGPKRPVRRPERAGTHVWSGDFRGLG
jgi:MmgE/PrpD N-terminal domain